MFNHTLSEAEPTWRFVPFRLVVPSAVPNHLQDYTCLLKQTSPEEHIVKASVKSGVFLTKTQLDNVLRAIGVARPSKGSGKNGSVIKTDLAQSLLRHLFPDEPQDGDECKRMWSALMGTTKQPTCPEEVLAAIDALDPISQEDFRDMKNCARNQQHTQSQAKHARQKAQKHDADAEEAPEVDADAAERRGVSRKDPPPAADAQPSPAKQPRGSSDSPQVRTTFTPGDLRSLIPGRGHLAGVYVKRLPAGINGKHYQGFYPQSEEGSRRSSCLCVGHIMLLG